MKCVPPRPVSTPNYKANLMLKAHYNPERNLKVMRKTSKKMMMTRTGLTSTRRGMMTKAIITSDIHKSLKT